MNEAPKVSVIMPSLNVAPYIRQCLDSVLCQTLRDIEILCVDAGSTDGTAEILREYAERDPRVTVIVSDRKSYGYQMNLGMDAAKGRYMGIVETDDWAEPDMFGTLFAAAEADSLDVAKAGFYYYIAEPEEKNTEYAITSEVFSRRVFCPRTDFASPLEQAEFYNMVPSIWSAIYSLEFLRRNGIRFHETPGASFQDESFFFKVFALANRVRMLEGCFLHYRQDNAHSSIHSPGKIYCEADEFAEIERFLASDPELERALSGVKNRSKLNSYLWNYDRVGDDNKLEFLRFASKEFARDMASGWCEKKYYTTSKWNELRRIISDPDGYHAMRQGTAAPPAERMHPGIPQRLKAAWKGLRRSLRVYGLRVTARKAVRRLRRRIAG